MEFHYPPIVLFIWVSWSNGKTCQAIWELNDSPIDYQYRSIIIPWNCILSHEELQLGSILIGLEGGHLQATMVFHMKHRVPLNFHMKTMDFLIGVPYTNPENYIWDDPASGMI